MNDGGPAFARPSVPIIEDQDRDFGQPGMSLRDYFAGQALVGLLAFPLMTAREPHLRIQLTPEICRDAYAMADAMLQARKQ